VLAIASADSGGTGRMEGSGSSTGAIQVGDDFLLGRNGTLAFELDAGGVTPVSVGMGVGAVTPVVNLDSAGTGRASLEVSLLDLPPHRDIELIDFHYGEAVTGTFDGLPEGAALRACLGNTFYFWTITYVGDDGNDVVLEFQRVEVVPEGTVFLIR
jgi:hypothetical protein